MWNIRRILGPALLIAIALISTSAVAQRGQKRKQMRNVDAATAAGAKGITQRQLDRMTARIELAAAIVERFGSEAKARGLSDGWRQPVLETLLPMSLEALERISQQAAGLDALAAVTREVAEDPNVLGNSDADLVYTPLTPCRFIDTRLYAAGPINGTRAFDLDLTGATYGGSGTCNPTMTLGASGDVIGAIAANLTIVGPALAPGFLAVKPTAAAPISSLLNWYQAGPSVQVANAGVFQTANGVDNFVIQTSATTDVIMDLLGAFIAPQATALQTSVVSDTVIIPIGGDGPNTSPSCPVGYTLTGGGCGTGDVDHILENSEPNSDSWFCYSNNNSGVPSDLTAHAICSRVPGR